MTSGLSSPRPASGIGVVPVGVRRASIVAQCAY